MSQTVQRTESDRPAPTDRVTSTEPTTSGNRTRAGSRLGALGFVLVALCFLAYAVNAGMSVENALRAVLAVVVTQLLPGALVWRYVRPRNGWWFEDAAMGLAIGAAIAVGAQTLAGLTRVGWLSAGVGIALAVALISIPATRRRILEAKTSPVPVWWGTLVALPALATLAQIQRFFRVTPLSWPSGIRRPYFDAYFHLGLASQISTRGPSRFPSVESEPLAYHWFSHAWVAQVSRASGAALDETLFRFLPVVMPLIVALAVAAAAVRLSGRLWAGPVAAILTMATVGANFFGKHTFTNINLLYHPRSPSLAFATPLLLGVVVVLALRWRQELGRGGLALLVALSVGATGAKGSTLPLIVAGLALAIVAMFVIDRRRVRGLLVDLVIVVGCALFTYVVVFRGGGTERLRLDPAAAAARSREADWLGGVSSVADQSFALALAVGSLLSQAIGLVGLLCSRRSRRDPLTWLLLGSSLAAAATVVLLTGLGKEYFARSAAPLMALGSTLGLVVLVDRLGGTARRAVTAGIIAGPIIALAPVVLFGPVEEGGTRRAVAMLAVAAAALAVVTVAAAIGTRDRWRIVMGSAIVVAILSAGTTVVVNSLLQDPPLSFGHPVSSDEIEAARWIRDHSDVDDLVMTNRHCANRAANRKCDTRRFLVAAFSERQVLLESWDYTPEAVRAGRPLRYWQPDLQALNDGFIRAPTAAAHRQLKDLGVRWVYVDKTIPHAGSLESFAELRFSNPTVDVYEL